MDMQNSIEDFYSEVVFPFVREFEQSRAALRHAYGAVWALDCYASHIFYFYKEVRQLAEGGDIDFKKLTLVPQSRDFKLILDVSAAAKLLKEASQTNLRFQYIQAPTLFRLSWKVGLHFSLGQTLMNGANK